jgi:hypothetical protein
MKAGDQDRCRRFFAAGHTDQKVAPKNLAPALMRGGEESLVFTA